MNDGVQLAELSHDLRTPLTSVRLLVRALSDGLVEDERRAEYLGQIDEQISLLSTLVDDLHSLARERAGGHDRRIERLRPDELIATALATMRIQADVNGVTLEDDLSPHLPCIHANTTGLQRVLLNLIENAIRHARKGGKVVVRAERTLGGVEIEVEDDGEGIAAEERDRVFAPFHGGDGRVSPARSGLGLAIARATVEAHGGRIWLADSPCGTRIRLALPAAAQRRIPRRGDHGPRRKF